MLDDISLEGVPDQNVDPSTLGIVYFGGRLVLGIKGQPVAHILDVGWSRFVVTVFLVTGAGFRAS